MTNMHHYLWTIPLSGFYAHGYVVSKENPEKYTESISDRMLSELEKKGISPAFPMILITNLEGEFPKVEAVLKKALNIPSNRELSSSPGAYRFVMFALPSSDPSNDVLMELH